MEKEHYEIQSISSKIVIESTEFFTNTFLFLSSLTSHPLFSITVAFYSLILLYFPRFFLNLIFSPVLISTGIIISTLLKLGTTPKLENGNQCLSTSSSIPDHEILEFISCEPEKETETQDITADTKSLDFPESFVEYWNLSAPLDVIYEEEDEVNGKEVSAANGFSCLGRYYPESDDTGSDSDDDFDLINGWDSPQNMCYRWEDEEGDDDKEGGLIEIELNDEKRNSFRDYHGDEAEEMDDNLIEIEIS